MCIRVRIFFFHISSFQLFLCFVFYLIRSVFYTWHQRWCRFFFCCRSAYKIGTRTWMVDKNTEKACSSCYRMSKTLSFCSFVALPLSIFAKGHKMQNLWHNFFILHFSSFLRFLLAEWQSEAKQRFVTYENVKQKSSTTKCFFPTIPLLGFSWGSTSCNSNERYDRLSCSLAYNCLFIIFWNNKNKHEKKLFPVCFYRSYHIISYFGFAISLDIMFVVAVVGPLILAKPILMYRNDECKYNSKFGPKKRQSKFSTRNTLIIISQPICTSFEFDSVQLTVYFRFP